MSALIGSITCQSALANKEAGNGGDAIQIGNKLYLLDLVEAGVEESPQIDLTAQPSAELSKRVDQALPEGFPKPLVAKKLTEIERINPMMSHIILRAMELYQWKLVNSALLDVADENTELVVPANKLFQLAIRKSVSILVDRSLWQKLDDANKTALVFHETLYALDAPRNLGYDIVPRYPAQYQSSPKAREINGYLFSELSSKGQKGLERFSDFSHITMYSGGVSDDGYFVRIAPFLQITVASDFRNKTAFHVVIEPETTPSSAQELITQSCTYAVENKLPLQLGINEGKKMSVGLSVYYSSLLGQKNYVYTYFHDGITLPKETLSPQSTAACVSQLTTLVNNKLEEMKRDYK
jgi:hypothetical protein